MRAIHKYKKAAKAGDKEAQRRIAQSYGYRPSLWDNPKLVALLSRAGIIDTVNSDAPELKPHSANFADTETITL